MNAPTAPLMGCFSGVATAQTLRLEERLAAAQSEATSASVEAAALRRQLDDAAAEAERARVDHKARDRLAWN
eukprot:42698-Pleurochrysis_carterae.AAC.1